MGFSAKQVQALRRQPSHRHIRTREAHGRELTYLEGWYAISEANRIFGFDGWNRETVEIQMRPGPREPRHVPRGLYRPGPGHRAGRWCTRSSAKAMAAAKGMEHRPARCTTSRSRLPKPTPPNGRSPPSASPLVLSFTAMAGHPFRSPCPQQRLLLSRPCPSRYRPRPGWACIRMTPPRSRGRRATMDGGRIRSPGSGRRADASLHRASRPPAPRLSPPHPASSRPGPKPGSTRAFWPSPNPGGCATRRI